MAGPALSESNRNVAPDRPETPRSKLSRSSRLSEPARGVGGCGKETQGLLVAPVRLWTEVRHGGSRHVSADCAERSQRRESAHLRVLQRDGRALPRPSVVHQGRLRPGEQGVPPRRSQAARRPSQAARRRRHRRGSGHCLRPARGAPLGGRAAPRSAVRPGHVARGVRAGAPVGACIRVRPDEIPGADGMGARRPAGHRRHDRVRGAGQLRRPQIRRPGDLRL